MKKILFLVFIHLHRICWELDIKGVKPEDKLIDWYLFLLVLSVRLNFCDYNVTMKSGMLCANMWARKEMECFTPEILSLFSLEGICLKPSSPLTITQVYYTTEIRTGFKFPLQFLTYVVVVLLSLLLLMFLVTHKLTSILTQTHVVYFLDF